MSISTVITQCVGSFSNIALFVTDGYGVGSVVVVQAVFSGGYPTRRTLHKRREPVFADYGTALERLRLDQPKAAEVIQEVAARQAEDAHLDEQQKLDELRAEMRLHGLEMRTQHLAALNAERERLINAEISARIQSLVDAENATLLLMMASSV